MKISIRRMFPLLVFLLLVAGVSLAFSVSPVDLLRGNEFRVSGDESALSLDEGGGTLTVRLDGGKRVYLESRSLEGVKPGKVEFSFECDGVDLNESDYRVKEARYPVYVQVIFDEKPELSLRKSLALSLSAIWERKIWTRKSIIYAFGNRMPKGSVVNSTVSTAVVSVGDVTDVGKRVRVARDLVRDFTLAYGEPPKSNIYRLVIGFEGTNGEDSPKKVVFYSLKITGGGIGHLRR